MSALAFGVHACGGAGVVRCGPVQRQERVARSESEAKKKRKREARRGSRRGIPGQERDWVFAAPALVGSAEMPRAQRGPEGVEATVSAAADGARADASPFTTAAAQLRIDGSCHLNGLRVRQRQGGVKPRAAEMSVSGLQSQLLLRGGHQTLNPRHVERQACMARSVPSMHVCCSLH